MTPDLLVVANPVWEVSWLVHDLPETAFDPRTATERIEDGGGSALNTACALARAGRTVKAVGRVGDDPEGRAAVAALEKHGVTPSIEIRPGRTTKRNHLYVEQASGRTAFQAFLPEFTVTPWEERPEELDTAAFLLLDRLAARSIRWLQERHGGGLANGLNRNTPGLRGIMDPRLIGALPYLRYLQLPEQEDQPGRDGTGGSAGTDRPSPAADPRRIHLPTPFPALTLDEVGSLLDGGVAILVRTRAARGVAIHTRKLILEIPAVPTNVVDPTGAGDAFAAGFIDGLLAGIEIPGAAARGLDWAARACRHLGARAWLDREPPAPGVPLDPQPPPGM